MIDWSALVGSAVQDSTENPLKQDVYPPKSGNRFDEAGTLFAHQDTEIKQQISCVPAVPAVPATFEGLRVGRVFTLPKKPDGAVLEGELAPCKKLGARSCFACKHLARPGLSDGYCGGGRDDLEPAYGPRHPLRQLPPDQGENCQIWAFFEEK